MEEVTHGYDINLESLVKEAQDNVAIIGLEWFTVKLPYFGKMLESAFAGSDDDLEFLWELSYATHSPVLNTWGCILRRILNEDKSWNTRIPYASDAVRLFRQLTLIFYKLHVEPTREQVEEALENYTRNDLELHDLDPKIFNTRLVQTASKYVKRLLANVDPLEVFPRHGSGASECKVVPYARYESFRYCKKLASSFPYDKYFFSGLNDLADNPNRLLRAEEAPEWGLSARFATVPKDSRGPRTISVEPREYMYLQQGLRDLLVDTIRANRIAEMIGFDSAHINQQLALEASKDGSSSTVDLKDASDRVSLELVKELFPTNWYDAMTACRSSQVRIRPNTYLVLAKFASMGSALCFPVEAITFWAIAVAAAYGDTLLREVRRGKSPLDLKRYVRVFGDDIIVPAEKTQRVVSALESVGLLVNRNKTHTCSPYRESCGMDAYHGVDVTIVRFNHLPSNDAMGRHTTVAMFNNMLLKYGLGHIRWIRPLCEEWYGPLPVSSRYRWWRDDALGFSTCALVGPFTSVPGMYRKRYNSDLQVTQYLVPHMVPKTVSLRNDSWSYVLKWFCEGMTKLNRKVGPSDSRPIFWSVAALAKRCKHKYSWQEL